MAPNYNQMVDCIKSVLLNHCLLSSFLQCPVKITHLAKNEIIAIFWGECISSYGWRRDPAPLCGKGARFVPAINNS